MATRARLAAGIRTAVWVTLAFFGSLANLVFSPLDTEEPTPYLFLSLFGALSVPFVLIWRRRFPELVLVITVVASLILTIGSTTAWVALGSLIRGRRTAFWRDPWQWGGSIAVTAATYLAVIRDLSAKSSDGSISGILLGNPSGPNWSAEVPLYTAPLVTLILMAIVLGIIALVRARTQAAAAVEQVAGTRERNLHLNNEIARFEERERIARELHDSLGNALASVSLLSGAVRAQANDPAAVSSHAEQLQLAAQEATAQMHEIVRTYRSHSAPVASLADLHGLVSQNQARGALISATLDVRDSQQAPGAVERAVYRVVQELLTNAAKHAPDYTLTLRVSGGQAEGGVRIFASNQIPPPSSPYGISPNAHLGPYRDLPGSSRAGTGADIGGGPPQPGRAATKVSSGGSGIIGAAERVEQLGGWLHTGVENGLFIVQVWVPWRTRPGG